MNKWAAVDVYKKKHLQQYFTNLTEVFQFLYFKPYAIIKNIFPVI